MSLFESFIGSDIHAWILAQHEVGSSVTVMNNSTSGHFIQHSTPPKKLSLFLSDLSVFLNNFQRKRSMIQRRLR